MAGRPSIIRPVQLNLSLPEDLFARLKLRLFSEVEGRVPHGAYKRLMVELIKQYLESEPVTMVSEPLTDRGPHDLP